jgi:hypothetical protein
MNVINISDAVASERKASRKLPQVSELEKLPSTIEELFFSLAVTIIHHGPGQYAWPWVGWATSKDARQRLEHFEKSNPGRVQWVAFNGSESNDGPMTLNSCSGHAFVERVTNCGDTMLERKALTHKGTMPTTPLEAVRLWYGKHEDDVEDDDVPALPITIRMFSSGSKQARNNVLDARDYGTGLTAAEMPDTILSLNRGNKQHKLYLTGKHGQGASSTFQYADLTVIASRKMGTDEAAFTVVEKQWDEGAKTPTYRYLTFDGKIPALKVTDQEFSVGTLVRHVGYEGCFYNVFGENSIYGLLQRSLAQPLFPIEVYFHSMWASTSEKTPTAPGAGDRRIVRGTVNTLDRAWEETKNPPKRIRPQKLPEILHHQQQTYKLEGLYDFGGRVGHGELGQVIFTWWVAEAGTYKSSDKERFVRDVIRNWVKPERPILFTLDGQTHSEEPKWYITTKDGAGLWTVGQFMVVHIDCDGLSRQAKYEMFTSTREALKETEIKDMILDELIRRLRLDRKLTELNIMLASGPKMSDKELDDDLSGTLREYLKKQGIPFETITRRMETWRKVEEEREEHTVGGKDPPPPIVAQDPPTFIKWKFKSEPARMYPGQKYSWLFETDAPPSYWDPKDPSKSKIQVLANGVMYGGAGQMEGGRVRCHFKCPEDAKVGSKGLIQVQLHYATLAAPITSLLHVEVIPQPEQKVKPPGGPDKPGPGNDGGGTSGPKKKVKVIVDKKDWSRVEIPVLRPMPIDRTNNQWSLLGWPFNPHDVGFSIRETNGETQLFYNAEFPTFLEFKRSLTKRGLWDRFIKLYELKLIMHTAFQLNHNFVDEEDATPEVRKNMRNLLCAAAEDIIHAAKIELELEVRADKEAAAV